jgi:hypothetical protein
VAKSTLLFGFFSVGDGWAAGFAFAGARRKKAAD